jgi:NAD(P)-dependent dehydrogenase (short-subunit alcohol dehydrogenase family)
MYLQQAISSRFAEVNRASILKLEKLMMNDERWPFPYNPAAYFYPKAVHDVVGTYNIKSISPRILSLFLPLFKRLSRYILISAKRALITGVTGQDGSYLTELLLEKGYEVHGLMRRASLFNTDRVDHLYHDPHLAGAKLSLHYGDLSDGTGLRWVLETVDPDEIYNLGAQSHVRVSFEIPEYTADVVAVGTLRLIEAVRDHILHGGRPVRYYQAGSSEMFGATPPPQSESTPFYPRSPYGVSKLAAHWFAVNYREAYGLFICNGILFNHESPRRGETFVSVRLLGRSAELARIFKTSYIWETSKRSATGASPATM